MHCLLIEPEEAPVKIKTQVRSGDRWDWRNNPDRFGGTMVSTAK